MSESMNKKRKIGRGDCIVCSEPSSLKICLCQNKCEYDVCIDCTFKFSQFMNGSTLDHLRIKCMMCRNPIETMSPKDLVNTLLKKTPTFYAELEDPIRECKVALQKTKGNKIETRQLTEPKKPVVRFVSYFRQAIREPSNEDLISSFSDSPGSSSSSSSSEFTLPDLPTEGYIDISPEEINVLIHTIFDSEVE